MLLLTALRERLMRPAFGTSIREQLFAPGSERTLRLLEQAPPAIALLDVNLGRENSFPVADALLARGIPFVFATGYGEANMFPERFRHLPVLSKPYAPAEMRLALLRRAGEG